MNYKVIISLKNASRFSLTAQAPYYGSGIYTDMVTFTPRTITIEGERNARYDDAAIFHNVQNTLYNQILKCLQIHYCFEGSNAGVARIEVTADGEFVGARDFSTFQPYPSFDAPIPFDGTALRRLLLEDDDSFTLRIIISHWLSQGENTSLQRRLESVWRTFEQICNHLRHAAHGKRSNVAEGLDRMVSELTLHPTQYVHAGASVCSETKDTLRQLRWHDMIENNYPETIPGGSSLQRNYENYKARLCDPYIDERVCTLMKDILPYRCRELQNYGLYTAIEADLNNKIALHQTKDIDVVAILCHYAYYLRNRLFHGQTLVRGSIFEPVKPDEMRIGMLSDMLSVLTVELINNYHAL